MTSTHSSAACCSTPVPKATADYTPKGTYQTLANTKTYITGPASATKALFHIYDIFGFRTPTLQGADILASAGYLVVMPDFFAGSPAEPAWMDGSEEGGKNIGFCWGGKIVSLTSAGPSTHWKVGIQTSPAQVDPEDAKKITIPSLMLASEGEDAETVRKWGESFDGEVARVERSEKEVHGWMSARASLEDGERRAEFERGYQVVLEFLGKYV
ncbi:hypothetical protein M409DRAFT_61980 [Zasmidium cellare ATCC 36951]|uniref:Dienelactone hydrolase domain-containing protein n=1 Tax=Zasmidium cellare ATCC 36951 TaxID=1080233 RepID=A0A6A6D5M2_ZASCE|nr:uncharacterized protein M409DRAFT_61980 [Zasmidium cellare ATCC 36951]KAF2173670.1 hypothetical protein M409DRAFT_61980 [Zasmidium cellare ATCC 36951]